jgi:hypothetical protein
MPTKISSYDGMCELDETVLSCRVGPFSIQRLSLHKIPNPRSLISEGEPNRQNCIVIRGMEVSRGDLVSPADCEADSLP